MRCKPDELCWIQRAEFPGNVGRVVRTLSLRSDGMWLVEPVSHIWVYVDAFFFPGWHEFKAPFPAWIDGFIANDADLLPFRNLGEKDLCVPAPMATYDEARRRAWEEIAKTDDRLREHEGKTRLVCPKDGAKCLYGRRGVCTKCGREVGPNEMSKRSGT